MSSAIHSELVLDVLILWKYVMFDIDTKSFMYLVFVIIQ